MTSKPNSPALLVLAAGMGSRYGGLKQVDPVGPHGETLMDYSLYDAWKAGFSRVVFLIREEMHEAFFQQIASKYTGRMEVAYAYQSINDLPEGVEFTGQREKPWGTGHAVWCARHALDGRSFAVINADDFYGSATFTALIDAISQADSSACSDKKIAGSIIGFQLGQTLSDHGSVSRGICKIDRGKLSSVEEWSGISKSLSGIIGNDPAGLSHKLSGEEVVSMNEKPKGLGLPEEKNFHSKKVKNQAQHLKKDPLVVQGVQKKNWEIKNFPVKPLQRQERFLMKKWLLKIVHAM